MWDSYPETYYADRSQATPQQRSVEDETALIHANYNLWRQVFEGDYLAKKHETAPADASGEKPDKWPLRYNLARQYCMTHAGAMWGRGRTSREADDLFDVMVDSKVPGMKEHTGAAPDVQGILGYIWSGFMHLLRTGGITQQWAGGCVFKVSWYPASPNAICGIVIEMPEVESFYPVWDPMNRELLLSAELRYQIPLLSAVERYSLTPEQLGFPANAVEGSVDVREKWDRLSFEILFRAHTPSTVDKDWIYGYYLTSSGDKVPTTGKNPFINLLTGMGEIPIVYIPRVVTTHWYGDSLIPDVLHLMLEINKNWADVGDAIAGSSHIRAAVADFTGKQHRLGFGDTGLTVIPIPAQGMIDLGPTGASKQQARVYELPSPKVDATIPDTLSMLADYAEQAAGLTPASRGGSSGKSGFQVAMELLPTTNLHDWMRTFWSMGLRNIGRVVLAILASKRGSILVPINVTESFFRLRQRYIYRSMVPRDRWQEVQEVVALYSAQIIPPEEALSRLGDIEDIPGTIGQLWWTLQRIALLDALVAGRQLRVPREINQSNTNPEIPPLPRPEVQPTPEGNAQRQIASATSGQASRGKQGESPSED